MPHFDAPKELSRLASRSASADPVSNPDMMRVLMGLANHLPGMVAYWDASLICIFANNAYVEWFGKTAEEMLGISIRELLGEALYARNEIYIRGAMAGERQAFERTLTKPSGEVGHTWAQYIPDIAATGEVRGMYVLVTDITELRNTARALQETNIELEAARKRAEQAAEAKSSFLASMSHEIRTPLTSIIGYAELLRDAPGASEDVPRFGEQIAAAGTGLMSLVNDILDHTRLEAREIKLEPLPCDVVAVTREIADLLSIQAAAKGLDLAVEILSEVPADLMLDEMRLRQVVQNL
ncbi:MAG: PAS domain-containing sensor histidine kinase, partial [Asticcacaulis sp.]